VEDDVTDDQYDEVYRRLRLDLRKVNDEIARLQHRQESLGMVLKGLEELHPELRPSSDGDPEPRRGKAAVLHVLKEARRPLTISEIVQELQLRDWLPQSSRNPDAAVRQSLRRLDDDGESIVKTQAGRSAAYSYSTEAPETGASARVYEGGSHRTAS
jgi:hypothetical protein